MDVIEPVSLTSAIEEKLYQELINTKGKNRMISEPRQSTVHNISHTCISSPLQVNVRCKLKNDWVAPKFPSIDSSKMSAATKSLKDHLSFRCKSKESLSMIDSTIKKGQKTLTETTSRVLRLLSQEGLIEEPAVTLRKKAGRQREPASVLYMQTDFDKLDLNDELTRLQSLTMPKRPDLTHIQRAYLKSPYASGCGSIILNCNDLRKPSRSTGRKSTSRRQAGCQTRARSLSPTTPAPLSIAMSINRSVSHKLDTPTSVTPIPIMETIADGSERTSILNLCREVGNLKLQIENEMDLNLTNLPTDSTQSKPKPTYEKVNLEINEIYENLLKKIHDIPEISGIPRKIQPITYEFSTTRPKSTSIENITSKSTKISKSPSVCRAPSTRRRRTKSFKSRKSKKFLTDRKDVSFDCCCLEISCKIKK